MEATVIGMRETMFDSVLRNLAWGFGGMRDERGCFTVGNELLRLLFEVSKLG